MRKIAVGIIAVFLVQVGFQFYTVVERTNYGYPRLSSVVPPTEMKAPAVTDLENESLAFAPLERISSVDTMRLSVSRASHLRRPAPKMLTAKKPLFPPVIITIPPPTRYETAVYKPDKYESATSKPTHPVTLAPEKRSFSKRALTAAKRPYDLLKFVASKLF